MTIANYELRVAVVDLTELTEEYEHVEVLKLNCEEFYSIAETQGTVYSLGKFMSDANLDEINFTDSVIRFMLVNDNHINNGQAEYIPIKTHEKIIVRDFLIADNWREVEEEKENKIKSMDFVVTIYKDMELADEIETCNSFKNELKARNFYYEQASQRDKFVKLTLEIEYQDGTIEETLMAHNEISPKNNEVETTTLYDEEPTYTEHTEVGEHNLVCPHCGMVGEPCDMPDLFFNDLNNTKEENEQAKLLEEMWEVGFNVVTCGDCGGAFIHRVERNISKPL